MVANADINTADTDSARLAPPSTPGQADKSIRKIAVLFTDIIGSTRFFQSHGNVAGRNMLQQHEGIVSTTIARFGGTVVKNLGDSIMAYFLSPLEATKTAVQIQKEFEEYNKEHGNGHKIHVRIGIHFDEGIVEDTDIFGNAVNIASKITNLAGSNQIFISDNVFALVNALPSLAFEAVEARGGDTAQPELLAYRVRWEGSIDFAPALVAVLYMKPLRRKQEAGTFDSLWNSLVAARDLFWEGRVHSETILQNQTVILTAKKLSIVLDVVSDVLTFLKESIQARFTVPLQIIIDAGPPQKIDKLVREEFRPEWEELRPGTVFLSAAAHYLIEEEKLSITTVQSLELDTLNSLYEISSSDYQQKQNEILFPYQSILYKGEHSPCFYCGSREHAIRNCPSKQLTTVTDTLNQLGYLSFEQINDVFLAYLKSPEEAKNLELQSHEEAPGQEPSAGLGIYELNQLFQLRFLRNIWEGTSNDWNEVSQAQHKGDGPGDLIWLAQDCIRVSNLSRAESLLQTCLKKYPEDFRTYCTLAFLSIEQGKYPRSKQYLDRALRYTRTLPQKIYILFLLARLHELDGDSDGARRKAREIKMIQPYCSDATYQEIVLNFRDGQDDTILKRLISLIKMNREYYIKALIDPNLASFSQAIHPELKNLLTEIRQKAQRKAFEAEKQFASFEQSLVKGEEEDAQKVASLMSKMEALVSTTSYFGYSDIADFADSVISICHRAKVRRKEQLMNKVDAIQKRINSIVGFTKEYRTQLASSTPYRQLRALQSRFKENLGSAIFFDSSRYKELSGQCKTILRELDAVEVELRRLKMTLDIKRFCIIFLKNSAVILSIILFAGVVILPTVAYYLSTFLPEFGSFTGSGIRAYHKYVLILGVIVGLGLTFLKSFKTFFKNRS